MLERGKSVFRRLAFSIFGEKGFHFWLANEHKFDEWLKHEPLITSAILAHKRRTDAPREFEVEFQRFRTLLDRSGRSLPMRWEEILPCLDDRSSETPFDRHYAYHPAWAARVLARTRPVKHVDISSILCFGTIVSAFIPVDFYDFRPAPLILDNFSSASADLTRLCFSDNSIVSLSSMHVIEHVGLGRYGEALDPDGDLKAIRELCRVLAPGGNLMVAVPVGRARIQYNAHRIYDDAEFRGYFAGLELVEFTLIPDGDVPIGLVHDAQRDLVNAQEYGCGCYWFRKPSTAGT
jgi:SAM-dependent methyltransferase